MSNLQKNGMSKEFKNIRAFLLAESKTLTDVTLKTWLGTGEGQITKRAAALLDDDLEALYAYYKSKPRPRDTVGEMRYNAIVSQYKKRHHITEAIEGALSVGDTVEVTGGVQFQDCVGEVESLHGGFVVVKIYSTRSSHSFHVSDLRKIDDNYHGGGGDDDDDEDDYADESFFVVIHDSDENKSFIGELEKIDGRWREHVVSGKPPYGWGSSRYMSYLSDRDIMSWLRKDFKHYDVDGPFDSESEAREFVEENHGTATLRENEELKDLGRTIKKNKKSSTDELPPDDEADVPTDDEADVPTDDEADVPTDDDEPEVTTADTDTVPADDVTPEFKVGDIVTPNKGQHEGEPHEVVGIHPDGGLLIKPEGLDDNAIKYTAKSKTAKIRTDDVQIVESRMLKRGLLKAVSETRLDNGALTMPELLKLRNGLYEAGDQVGYRILVQAITEAKSGAKPNMRGVEAKLAAHAKSKGDYEAKYGTLSPGDQVSYEQCRKRLLKDLSRERSKANCSEGLKFEDPKGVVRKVFNKVMGIPSGKYKYAVGDTVSYEMNPIEQKNGRGTSKVVELGDGHHYKLANGAIVNQNEIKKVVKEGIEGKKLFRISCRDGGGVSRTVLLHATNEEACRAHCAKKGYKVTSLKDVTGEEVAPTRKSAALGEARLDEISNRVVDKARLSALDKKNAIIRKMDKVNDQKFGSSRAAVSDADAKQLSRLDKFNAKANARLNKGNTGPSEDEQHAEYNRKRATGGVGTRKG